MKTKFFAGALALALAGAASGPAVAQREGTSSAPAWLADVSGQKLSAVDGSTITLTPDSDGMTIDKISSGGAEDKSFYTTLNNKLGTISSDEDSQHLLGFFRQTDAGLEAQYADGHTESLMLNAAGGISLTVRAASSTTCSAWYPADHVFSDAERRAALAAYANRLGLSTPANKKSAAQVSTCVTPTRSAKVDTQPALMPAVVRTASKPRRLADAPVANASGLVPVMVRTSEVHTIDGAESIAHPPPDKTSRLAANLTAQPSAAPAQKSPLVSVALKSSVEAGHGASDCLSVDTDGASVGFHNQCSYNVAFAFCLQKATDPNVTCDAGAQSGDVAANSFAPLLLDTNIKAEDADHDFRWVACSGSKGEVEAHLDRSDPPSGRCIRVNAS